MPRNRITGAVAFLTVVWGGCVTAFTASPTSAPTLRCDENFFVSDYSTGASPKPQTLHQVSGSEGDEYGYAVAQSANHIAIGARFQDVGGSTAIREGVVSVFSIDSNGQATLESNLYDTVDLGVTQFGRALSFSEDSSTLLIGAPKSKLQGRVFVYTDNAGSFSKTATLVPYDAGLVVDDDMNFGSSVLVYKPQTLPVGMVPIIAVGATKKGTGNNSNSNLPGQVQLFFQPPGQSTWVPSHIHLTSSGIPPSYDAFGFSLAYSNGILVIGAPYMDGPNGEVRAGKVFVKRVSYTPGTGGGSLNVNDVMTLENPSIVMPNKDRFGYSVAISSGGEFIFVGAPNMNSGIGKKDTVGKVSVFRSTSPSNSAYTLHQMLARLDSNGVEAGVGRYRFGSSVSFDDGILAVGVPKMKTNGIQAGAVVTYNMAHSKEFYYRSTILPEYLVKDQKFGYVTSLFGSYLCVGAPYADMHGSLGGNAMLFPRQYHDDCGVVSDLTLPPSSSPTATPTSAPTATTTMTPTESPTVTMRPTTSPTSTPTSTPTASPTTTPTESPTVTMKPTTSPTSTPTSTPTATPTMTPTESPTVTMRPTTSPTSTPTSTPTASPTTTPTESPTVTMKPTTSPTSTPTSTPTATPTMTPTESPTVTMRPTTSPTSTPTSTPTASPTTTPTESPTVTMKPTTSPTSTPTATPTMTPTESPTVTMRPTTSPTTTPTTTPTTSPTSTPTTSPTVTSKPTTSPTTTPTATPTVTQAPTVSPTIAPTATPTHSPSVPTVSTLACNQVGGPSIEVLPGSYVEVQLSRAGEVCVLSSSIGPIARSYDNQDWELMGVAAVDDTMLTCVPGSICMIQTPDLSGMELKAYAPPSTLSSLQRISNFLTQATFGPRLEEINDFSGTFKSWIVDQVGLPASSHREYLRKRIAPRVRSTTTVGGRTSPCDSNSRWHRYAFNEHDVGKNLDITSINNGEYYEISVNGFPRLHTTNLGSLGLSTLFAPYKICDVDELPNTPDLITLGSTCSHVIQNPDVQFHEPPTSRILATGVVLQELNPIVPRVKLNSNSVSPCPYFPPGPVFIQTTVNGEYYMHDSRLSLVENTPDSPYQALFPGTACPNVGRNPFNSDSCIISSSGCEVTRFGSALLQLTPTTIREFYTVGGMYVYKIEGLRLDDSKSPCDSSTSRWLIHSSPCGSSATNLESATLNTLVSALSSSDDENPILRDISIPTGSVCTSSAATIGAKVDVQTPSGIKCFEHVHEHLFNVYDFSGWALYSAHPGNQVAAMNNRPNPITKHAELNSDTNLLFPSWHPQDRWDDNQKHFPLLGRFGDTIDYQDLPSSVQSVPLANHFGAAINNPSNTGDVPNVLCGSPGEVATTPEAGARFGIAITDRNDVTSVGPFDQLTDRFHSKSMVWTTLALEAPDQLRQRMAWALSQIFVVAEDMVSNFQRNEAYTSYYDIFVRHGLGNYREILREVSYHSLMGRMLTYMGSQSYSFCVTRTCIPSFPDENYAREIMQLFTIGLFELNQDGTPKLDSQGKPIATYDNDDITEFARTWTGFTAQLGRGNIENVAVSLSANYVDPMRLQAIRRDPFPKLGLRGLHIGDGYPLCQDLPSKPFLVEGATFRFLGKVSVPEVQKLTTYSGTSLMRLNLEPGSQLYNNLCNPDPSTQKCRYSPTVELSENLACQGAECNVDTVQIVKLPLGIPYCPAGMRYESFEGDANHGDVCIKPSTLEIQCPTGCESDPSNPDVAPFCFEQGTVGTQTAKLCRLAGNEEPGAFYEYIRPACVELPFFNDGKKIGRTNTRLATCANPKLAVASEACCYDSNDRAYGTCNYDGERVTYDTAVQRCNVQHPGLGYDICHYAFVNQRCKQHTSISFFWTNSPCDTKVKVLPDGRVAIVHHLEQTPQSNHNTVEHMHKLVNVETQNWFRVVWDGEVPSVVGNNCANAACETIPAQGSQPSSCLCSTNVVDSLVFTTTPSADDVLNQLHIGSFKPSMYGGTYQLRDGQSTSEVKVYSKGSAGPLTADTIFQVVVNGVEKYFRNIRSTVTIVGSSSQIGSFRNPPSFNNFLELADRDAIYETDAVIDHLLYHPNTAPFVARNFINRFITSNPSTRYLKVVADAFKSGEYQGIGSRKYGDLAATAAALLLDQEARSGVVEADPSFGKFQEPLLRVIHFMRSMQLQSKDGSDLFLDDTEDIIGMMAYKAPTVFSFFQYDVSVNGAIRSNSLVAPEGLLSLQGPNILGLLNSMTMLIKSGLNYCGAGLGYRPAYRTVGCYQIEAKWRNHGGPDNQLAQGKLHYTPTPGLTSMQVVEELNLILLAGKLGSAAKTVIANEYEIAKNTLSEQDALMIAQQLITVTPEFNSMGLAPRTPGARTVPPSGPGGSLAPFKGVIYVNLAGGMDSFNILVPHSQCAGEDLFQQYYSRRGNIAHEKTDLLEIDVPSGTQPCNKFGIHPQLTKIKELYEKKEALFMANLGPLLEPTSLPLRTANTPPSLFSHNVQTKHSQTLLEDVFDIGVLGRLRDELHQQGRSAISFTIAGGNHILNGEGSISPGPDSVHQSRGVGVLDPYPISDRVRPSMDALNSMTTSNVFGETWSQTLQYTIGRSEVLNQALDTTVLDTPFDADNNLSYQFRQICKLIKARSFLNMDRGSFYTSLGGFDTHGDAKDTLANNMDQVNAAVGLLVDELEAQGLWDSVTVVFGSEFGRTLTSNGVGTDHGWGGHYFAVGGSLNGGKVLGSYPSDLREGTPLDAGRGRVVPTTSWEAPYTAIAKWMGVTDPDALDRVVPLRHRFPDNFAFNDFYDV